MNVQEIIAKNGTDIGGFIDDMKKGRLTSEPNTQVYKSALDPLSHDIFDKLKRPDKKVKVDNDDENAEPEYRMEPVARIALALQKLIVKRAVAFIFGNPVELDTSTADKQEQEVLAAVRRALYDIKQTSFNRRVARNLFSSTEVAEIWYPVEKDNSVYGFPSKFKLRCGIFSPLKGDKLYPYFDETGDMIAFSREFNKVDETDKITTYFETYTDTQHFLFTNEKGGFELVEGYPKGIAIGKIPIVYGQQPSAEWDDVQILIERLETLLSNFADTNDYHASPKIFIQGEVKGFAKKGETGAIIEGEEGSTAQYLSWQNAPEAVKTEIETLLRMIYTITQTPDISFDAVKGLGSMSGIALKLLFMDAHLKVQDHLEVFDEYLQRRTNIIKAYIGNFNVKLKSASESLMIEPVVTPYMITDEASELKIWIDANGGNPVISQRESFRRAGLTHDPDADYKQYQDEQSSKNAFMLGEPTE